MSFPAWSPLDGSDSVTPPKGKTVAGDITGYSGTPTFAQVCAGSDFNQIAAEVKRLGGTISYVTTYALAPTGAWRAMKVNITDLQTAINARRVAAGLSAYSFSTAYPPWSRNYYRDLRLALTFISFAPTEGWVGRVRANSAGSWIWTDGAGAANYILDATWSSSPQPWPTIARYTDNPNSDPIRCSRAVYNFTCPSDFGSGQLLPLDVMLNLTGYDGTHALDPGAVAAVPVYPVITRPTNAAGVNAAWAAINTAIGYLPTQPNYSLVQATPTTANTFLQVNQLLTLKNSGGANVSGPGVQFSLALLELSDYGHPVLLGDTATSVHRQTPTTGDYRGMAGRGHVQEYTLASMKQT